MTSGRLGVNATAGRSIEDSQAASGPKAGDAAQLAAMTRPAPNRPDPHNKENP
jgi:hypothetical protein